MKPQELTAALITAAQKAGADQADALAIRAADIGIAVREAVLEEAESAEALDYGLRVIIGQKQASVSASDPSPAVIDELAARAVAMAREAPDDPWCGLADADRLADASTLPDLQLADTAPQPDPAQLRELAERIEAAALDIPDVAQVESANANWRQSRIALATSHGFAGTYARTTMSLSASAVAGEGLGMETDYDYASRSWIEDLPSPEDIGITAGQRAAERLGARKAKTGAYPVLFDQRVAGTLIGHLISAINGTAVARGASWLKDAMDGPVLPKGFTLMDDPHRLRGAGSRPFDGEGMALSPRSLVENGVLQGWVLDSATARQLSVSAPGGARRGFGSPPGPGTSNLSLTEGTHSCDALIRDMGEGLIVTSLIGSSISATTGAYSRGASGFWVENGEIAYPVNELTIAGSLGDFLKRLIAGNDADKTKSLIVPSLLIEGLTVASGS